MIKCRTSRQAEKIEQFGSTQAPLFLWMEHWPKSMVIWVFTFQPCSAMAHLRLPNQLAPLRTRTSREGIYGTPAGSGHAKLLNNSKKLYPERESSSEKKSSPPTPRKRKPVLPESSRYSEENTPHMEVDEMEHAHIWSNWWNIKSINFTSHP